MWDLPLLKCEATNFLKSAGQTKPTLETAFELPNFNPWMEGKLEVGEAIYCELWWLFTSSLAPFLPTLLLQVAFLKLRSDHSKNTQFLSHSMTLGNEDTVRILWEVIKYRRTKQGKTQRRGSFILLRLCVSVYPRKGPRSWVWNSRPFIIWFLPISESLDPIAYQSLFNLRVFSAIQNCSHASKLCRCRVFCLEWSRQFAATSPQSPRWRSNPWTIYHIFWLKLPEFHRHLLGLSWGPVRPVRFYYILLLHRSCVESHVSTGVTDVGDTSFSIANSGQQFPETHARLSLRRCHSDYEWRGGTH